MINLVLEDEENKDDGGEYWGDKGGGNDPDNRGGTGKGRQSIHEL